MTKSAAPRRHLPTSPFSAPTVSPPKKFAVGERVTHDQYGLGRIVGVEDDLAVLVDFGSRQERLTTPFARLNKL